MANYVQKINGNYLAAYEVIPNSPLAQKIAELDVGAFAVVPLTSGTNPVPDPESAVPPVALSHKIIYLTKDSSSTASDPYTEWIYTENNTWEIIGNTSMNLSQYKMVQTAVSDPTVPSTGTTTSLEFIDTISQDAQGVITPTKKALPNATSTNPGIVQLGSDTAQTTAAETVTSTANRTYAIQKDANGKLVVNVPWTDAGSALTFETGHAYNPSTNPAVTVSSITSRIEALDATVASTGGTNVALSVAETDGVITGVTVTTDNTENKNNKVTAWSATPDNTNYPSEKLVKDSLDTKQDTVTGTNGNFAGFDTNGTLVDSGSKASDFATSAQGTKADTALQGGKIVGEPADLPVDSNYILQIPKATSGTPASAGQSAVAGDFGVVQIECIEI